jgi:hypothetical protein
MIDRTAPVVEELFYETQRFNSNGEYHYVFFDCERVVGRGDYTIYYKVRDINENYKTYDNGRVPLYSYYFAKSGIYYVDVMLVDRAGNSAVVTAELNLDVEGPTIGGGEVKLTYNEQTQSTDCIIYVRDIVDAQGYYYHMHFLIWDQEAYDNGGDAIVELSFFTEPGEYEFSYDASHLPDGTTYYFLAYVTDDLINGSYSLLYYFDKVPPAAEQ